MERKLTAEAEGKEIYNKKQRIDLKLYKQEKLEEMKRTRNYITQNSIDTIYKLVALNPAIACIDNATREAANAKLQELINKIEV